MLPGAVLQYKETEAVLKQLQADKEAVDREMDQLNEGMMRFEANVSAADEERRSCRKQLAEVGASQLLMHACLERKPSCHSSFACHRVSAAIPPTAYNFAADCVGTWHV